MTGMTRGPLPPRVYWVRRLMVLGIAALLVVGIAQLLGGGGGSAPDRAATAAQTTTPGAGPSTNGSQGTAISPGTTAGTNPGQHVDDPVTRVAMPSGPCNAADVAITPSVPEPVAGRDITLVLELSTLTTPACTWTISPRTTAVKITSGSDLIWTSVQCPSMIPTRDLVLRQGGSTRVKLTWNAMRSEPGCPRLTQWAMPGTYHLHVSALAGHPQDVPFVLTAPSPVEVTKTAHPHPSGGKSKNAG